VVLPGSKSTVSDLQWLRANGMADAILARAKRKEPILGVCGGCQMLGDEILDPHDIEASSLSTPGLGLLPVFTQFAASKTTAQVRARAAAATFLTEGAAADCELRAFEIHMGHLHPRQPGSHGGLPAQSSLAPAFTARSSGAAPAAYTPTFAILGRNGLASDERDGAVNADGTVVGTLLHGLFENAPVMTSLLDHLRQRRGLPARGASAIWSRESAYERLADAARQHLDGPLLRQIAGLG
jgi:adenosylcobyric acid synthase